MKVEISMEDIKSYLRGKEQHPIMHVSGKDDPDYMVNTSDVGE